MKLDASALNSSIFVSIFVLSISSYYSIAVSNLVMLEMLILSRRFSYADNLDEITVIWSDKGWIYVLVILSFSRRSS